MKSGAIWRAEPGPGMAGDVTPCSTDGQREGSVQLVPTADVLPRCFRKLLLWDVYLSDRPASRVLRMATPTSARPGPSPWKRISLRPGWEDAALPESATVAASPSAIGAHIEGRHTSSVKGRQYGVLAASRLNSAIAAVSSHGQLYANPRGCIPIKLYSQKQEMGQIRPTGCHLPTLALSQLSSCLCSGHLSPTSSHAGCAA